MWAAVAAVPVLVAGALIAGTVLRSRDPARGPQVLVVGDSVTYMSRNAITSEFDWTSNVDPQGRPGFRTDELVPVALRKVDEDDPDVLVVLTGYNDLTQGVDTGAAVVDMMGIAADVPLRGVDAAADQGRLRPERGHARSTSGSSTWPRTTRSVHVATDWRDAVDAEPGPDPDPRLVTDDEIHPNEAGVDRLAQAMEEAVSRDCR